MLKLCGMVKNALDTNLNFFAQSAKKNKSYKFFQFFVRNVNLVAQNAVLTTPVENFSLKNW